MKFGDTKKEGIFDTLFDMLFKAFIKDSAFDNGLIDFGDDDFETVHFYPSNRTYEISQKLNSKNDDFSTDEFLGFAENVFTTVHKAMIRADVRPISGMVAKNLYNILDAQTKDNQIDAIEEYSDDCRIKEIYLTKYRVDDHFEYEDLAVCIIMTMPESDKEYINTLTFRRALKKTMRRGVPIVRAHYCPNCGAPVAGVSDEKCEYCGSILEAPVYEWELQTFEIMKRDCC